MRTSYFGHLILGGGGGVQEIAVINSVDHSEYSPESFVGV